jgi:hypothetical protein
MHPRSPTSTWPAVSVVIPTRDRPELALRAARCAVHQRGVAVEVIVVDDASVRPVRDRGYVDERVRVLRNDSPRGVAGARNRGLAEARGAWVAFLDDDDLWSPDKLASQLAVADSTGATLVHCGWVEVDQAFTALRVRRAHEAADPAQAILEHNLCGPPSGVIARREALVGAGGFDTALSVMADWDLWIRLAPGGLAAQLEPLVAYTVHEGGMHLRQLDAIEAELAILRAKHGDQVGGLRFLEWLATAHEETGRRWGAVRLRLGLALRRRRPTDLRRAAGALLGRTPRPHAGEPRPVGPGWLSAWRSPSAPAQPERPAHVAAAPGAES